jgi:hypothetical protein
MRKEALLMLLASIGAVIWVVIFTPRTGAG